MVHDSPVAVSGTKKASSSALEPPPFLHFCAGEASTGLGQTLLENSTTASVPTASPPVKHYQPRPTTSHRHHPVLSTASAYVYTELLVSPLGNRQGDDENYFLFAAATTTYCCYRRRGHESHAHRILRPFQVSLWALRTI